MPTPPATWGRTSSHTQPLGLHLFIVHHEPLYTPPPVRPSDSMKKLFGRDKPKAVKVTPGGRDDVSALGEVRSHRLLPRPRACADPSFIPSPTRMPLVEMATSILGRKTNGTSSQKQTPLYSPSAPQISPSRRLPPLAQSVTRTSPSLLLCLGRRLHSA